MTLLICVLEIVYLFLWMGSGNNIFFFVALAIFLWWIVEMRKETIRQQERVEKDTVRKLERIPHNRRVVSEDYLTALLLDEYSRTLYFVEREDVEENFQRKSYTFDEIYECTIAENKKHYSLISKGGIHGWSLLSERTDSLEEEEEIFDDDEKVKKLSLKLIVDDLSNPLIEFVFFEDDRGIDKHAEEYKEILEECKSWHRKIGVIIKRESQEKVAVSSWAHN